MALLFIGCTTDKEEVIPEVEDNDGPAIMARWIDHPSIQGDPAGPISDGENYTISIAAGFQLQLDVSDASNLESGVVYFLVNDDPTLREDIILEEIILGYNAGGLGYVFRVASLSLGNGEFYELQAGDKYYFYVSFSDEHDNTSSLSWTADLTD